MSAQNSLLALIITPVHNRTLAIAVPVKSKENLNFATKSGKTTFLLESRIKTFGLSINPEDKIWVKHKPRRQNICIIAGCVSFVDSCHQVPLFCPDEVHIFL
jgi:hypothetical protein